MEELRTVFSALAVLVSVISAWVVTRNWRQSNRPIVVAYVKTKKGGNKGIAYDLVVSNTGTRPATRIRLSCDRARLRQAYKNPDQPPFRDYIERCFDPSRELALLVHGESVPNSFGMTSEDPHNATWNYEAKIPVTISYSDLEGRKYKSELDVMIRDSDSLADGSWA